MTALESVFKALGDPARIQILTMLSENGEMCVCNITEGLGMTQSAVSHHLAQLRHAGLVNVTRKGQWSYYSLCCDTLADSVLPFVSDLMKKLESAPFSTECCNKEKRLKKVIFVCIHNSGRSQMAEAFAKRLGESLIEAESAGTAPGGELNPTAVQAMEEIGYDMSTHYPKVMTPEMVDAADRIITMGCGVNLEEGACPAVSLPSEDWGLEDPKGQPVEKVRAIRDEIKARVERLIDEMREC